MAVELVTGYSGTAHVSSSEDGARQAGTVGTGMYALMTVEEPFKAVLENANTVTVGPGDALINGRHVRLTGSTTFAVPVGTQGMQTSNLLVLRYEVAEDGTESASAVTLTGEPAASDPADPALATGNILDGDSPVDMPLYRVVTTGIESAQPVRLFKTVPPVAELGFEDIAGSVDADQLPVVPVSKGGTGATSAAAARTSLGLGALATLGSPLPVANGGTGATSGASALGNLGIKSWLLANVFKIGFVWVSYTSTSPASILGGTWTPITGRFPYFNAGTRTGGSNSATHSHGLAGGHAKVSVGGGSIGVYQSSGVFTVNNHLPGSTMTAAWSASNAAELMGSSQSATVSTMPSYQSLYAWRRTA